MTITFSRTFLVRGLLALLLAVGLLVAVTALQGSHQSQAFAAGGAPIYGRCKGAQQGVIKGDSNKKGRTGQYEIDSLKHGIEVPYEATTGDPSGQAQHREVSMTMALGRATPALVQALRDDETLTGCTFDFVGRSPDGVKEIVTFQVELKNAHVVDYTLNGRSNGVSTVTFGLTYQTITWTVPAGGISTQDDWSGPLT